MNSYSILGNSADASAVSKEMSSLLLYAFMFGETMRISGDITSGSVIDFQLPFSLSNVSSGSKSFTQGMYDTNCQQVFEFVDKPYAIKGYLACAIFSSANQGQAAKDFDNYRRVWLDNGTAVHTAFIGTVNSTNTDFYEPFTAAAHVTYMDVASSLTSYMKQSQISAQAIGHGLAQELNPGGFSSSAGPTFSTSAGPTFSTSAKPHLLTSKK